MVQEGFQRVRLIIPISPTLGKDWNVEIRFKLFFELFVSFNSDDINLYARCLAHLVQDVELAPLLVVQVLRSAFRSPRPTSLPG